MSDIEESGAALDEPTATTPTAQSGDKSASLSGDQSANTRLEESTTEQASQPNAQEPQQSDFAFGTSRGSGLARGKRKTATVADAPSAQPESNGYQPTAIEVITPKSEYSNPFTGETVVETPRQEEGPKAETPRNAPPLTRATPPLAESSAEAEVSTTQSASESTATTTTEAAPKSELKILPPAQTNRSGQSWESPSEHPARRAAAATADNDTSSANASADSPRSRSPRGSSEGRPTFQPERRSRSQRNDDGSEKPPREERPRREPRELRDSREPRGERSTRTASATTKPTAKPQGFFGWLKSLFGGGDNKRPKAPHSNEQSGPGGPKRRSRGGRGRGNSSGPRSGSEPFGRRHSGEKPVGERSPSSRNSEEQRDRPRSRNRGGRGGRSRNGPRSEGQQSGGAI